MSVEQRDRLFHGLVLSFVLGFAARFVPRKARDRPVRARDFLRVVQRSPDHRQEVGREPVTEIAAHEVAVEQVAAQAAVAEKTNTLGVVLGAIDRVGEVAPRAAGYARRATRVAAE